MAATLLALPGTALAQKKSYTGSSKGRNGRVKSVTVNNLPGYDDRWFHPGFYIGLNASRYRLEHSRYYVIEQNNGLGIMAQAKTSPGFSVGFVGDIRLADYFNLRFTPGVSFLTRKVEVTPLLGFTGQASDQEVAATQVDLPLLLKFKSDRRRNTRVYVVGGVRPSFNVGTRKRDPERSLLQVASTDFALEYGVGLDLFYPFFKFAPELRFSHGLPNLLQPGEDLYTKSFQRIRSNTVTLYFTFE